MSTSDTYGIHLGFWTNWARGPVFGATLTLNQGDANLLVAFIAFFVTYVGTRFWRISCLALHFIYSSRAPRDGLYHQRQAILRNATNAEDALYTIACLGWVWRKIARQTLHRILPLLLFTAVCVVGWTAAAGFSSRISTAVGNEVLIFSPNCGYLTSTRNDNLTEYTTFLAPWYAKRLESAATYAKQCYIPNSENSPACNTFVKPRLTSTVITNASCPFDKKICRSDNANIIIDTGLLDSHDDLGINAPESERFQYRRYTRCAPLVTENYTTQWNLSSDRSYTRYMYGEREIGNWTYEYPNDSFLESKAENFSSAFSDYEFGIMATYTVNGSLWEGTSMLPLPELLRYDSDLDLIFLSANKLMYSQPTQDPWFKATTMVGRVEIHSGFEGKMKVFRQDEPASPMGCLYQSQYCNPNLPEGERCTPLSGDMDTEIPTQALFGRESQAALAKFNWLYMGVFQYVYSLATTVSILGGHSLLARDSVMTGRTQGVLPGNQWQLEVQHWHDIYLAQIQSLAVDLARGPDDPNVFQWLQRPNKTEEHDLCFKQKIKSTQVSSFSVFGLCLTLVLGGLITLISYAMEPLMAYFWGRGVGRHYSQLEWCVNETLQLQRLAHESQGRGTWARTTDFIPVTKPSEELAPLDLTDPAHPVLLDEKPLSRGTTFGSVGSETTSTPRDKEKFEV